MTPIEYCSQCPECRSSIVHDYAKGEYICHMCGYVVIEERMTMAQKTIRLTLRKKVRIHEQVVQPASHCMISD